MIKRLKNLVIIFAISTLGMGLESCVTVEAYQKVYLNDEDMNLSAKKVEIFETNFQSYREGASGANGGKAGGGCGCN